MNPEENIFTYILRKRDDSLTHHLPILSMDEDDVEQMLIKEAAKNQQNFTKFMEHKYIEFDHKINNCKLKCAQVGTNYNDINLCYEKCEKGLQKYTMFVDQKISEMQKLMNQCVSNAEKLPKSLYEVFYCYQLYNRGFGHLHWLIKKESMYYQ